MLRRVRQDESLEGLSASTWNEFCSTAEAVQAMQSGGLGTLASPTTGARVRIKNATMGALPRSSIVWLEEPLFGPAANLEEFRFRTTMKASVPTSTTRGRIGVVADALEEGAIGRAIVGGLAVCKVNVTDADATFAREIAGDVAKLATVRVGPIPILWREAGSSGEKWAVILLGAQTSNPRYYRRLLPIVDATSSGTNKWDYVVSVDGTDTDAINRYEQTPWGHGQAVSFDQGDLTVGPVEGSAWCDLRDDGVWEFDLANPVVPACAVVE